MILRMKLIPILLICLVGLNVWAYLRFDGSRSATLRERRNLAQCHELAQRIRQLSERPRVAGTHELAATELVGRIEAAAKTAQIVPESLIRITPEPTRRVHDTAYLEKPTQVILRPVTLWQLTHFLHLLSSHPEKLQVDSLRLSAPREQDVGQDWSAEVVISYLIYSPRQDAVRVAGGP